MRSKSRAADPSSSAEAQSAGLAMLSRRELSAQGVRHRLARRGYAPEAVEAAVAALLESGALDDRRVALAVARTRAHVKRQGRDRIARELAALGVDDNVATEALDEVFGTLDGQALLEQALDRRLRPRHDLTDPVVQRRLFAALLRQGFAGSAISRALKSRARKGTADNE
jgi:regulatory protein